MRWACLLFPHLAIDGVLRQRPPSDRPLALITGPEHRRIIHSVNDTALACGVREGISVQAAQAVAAHCEWIEFDPVGVEHDRQLLAAWGYSFSSQVSTALPNTIVMEVGQSMTLFGPWPDFERRLRTELDALGFRHRVAVAPNPCAAHALACAR